MADQAMHDEQGLLEVNSMCGIVGYIGKEQAAPILLDGLDKLEYRGYDCKGERAPEGTARNDARW